MPPQTPQSARSLFRLQSLVILGALAAALIGCQKKGAPPATNATPTIPVSHPVEDEVTDFTEYTGRTDAVQSVTIRPRVTGELKGMPFAEGSEVRGPVKLLGTTLREGDLLFQVDPRPYKAAVLQAEGQLKLYKAQKLLAIANYDQDKRGFDVGTVSEFQMNQDKANIEQADARIESAEGSLETARLNLSFCTIHAPMSGRISRYYYTPGNLASANSTMLTTIVSMDQMYGYFDVEERTYQRILQGLKGDISSVKVRMAIEVDTS
jgi:RND family efflux transporter MFP subunit